MRRTAFVAGVLGAALAGPPVAAAAADPGAPNPNLTASVLSLDTGASVAGLGLEQSVVPLEEEKTDGGQVTVSISADVLFDFGKATLTAAARRRIAELAPRLRQARGAVQVSGHSDSVGDAAYNQTLSKQRADAVKAELQNVLAGAGPRIDAKGYGETRPVAPNEKGGKDDPEGRAKNRRVEIAYRTS
ncbi:OmpA family protein [Actinomadura verrucosospora]|uniref:OmpA/MotB domain-containing protein n=1 Tax=Actinomadura verrucosospora TaxID=46165 RepID=A0A7D3VSK1_ACTVE|nr:OmpA family protein [Actinomadura verrucosospora]QKG22055.1 OmpA/MotB domain-containing protein [Actinomadura verrucosospora]